MTAQEGDAEPRARFMAHGTFFVPSRREFVVWGTVTNGQLRAGMILSIPLGNLSAGGPIAAVDDVEIDGEPFTAVTVDTSEPDSLEFWRAMNLGVGSEELLAFDD